jgi:phospholipase C
MNVEHVIVLMLENRSFDHMLGLYPNTDIDGLLSADGITIDPKFQNVATVKSGAQSTQQSFPEQAGAAFVTDPVQIDRLGFGGPSHSFPAATMQLFSDQAPSSFPDPAPLSGFAQSYYNQLIADVKIAAPTAAQIGVPMTAFEHGQLPVLWQLAQEFCVCDQWYSEVPGPTQPNRLFVHAATSSGFVRNVWDQPFDIPTVYDALDKAGYDWAVYYFDLRDSDSFPKIKQRIDRVLPFDSFQAQAQHGTLPSYSFICPRYNEPTKAGDPPPNSQHAPYDVRNGENLIADVYEALRGGPLWEKTLLIVTYDEHGGYYDHVSPPASGVSSPDGLTSPTQYDQQQAQANPARNGYLLKPQYKFDFQRLGLRVPTVLISPWIPRGMVASDAYQHTSILATLRDLFGIGVLTARDRQAQSFAAVLSLAGARTDAPAQLNRPPLQPGGSAAALAAPPTDQQKDMWPYLAQLDGDKDSGKIPELPQTRAEAAKYVQTRLAAHQAFHRARRRKAAYRITHESGGYGWQLRDEDGKVIAVSPQHYGSQREAEQHIAQLRDLAPFARQIDPQ